jgi:cellulase/cellobiase CelA1
MGYWTRLVAFVAGLLAALTFAAPAAAQTAAAQTTTASPAAHCEVEIFSVVVWSSGHAATIRIKNVSDVPVTAHVTIEIPPPGVIVQVWNATATVSGTTTWLRPSVPVLTPGREIYIPYVATGQYVPPNVFCQPA